MDTPVLVKGFYATVEPSDLHRAVLWVDSTDRLDIADLSRVLRWEGPG